LTEKMIEVSAAPRRPATATPTGSTRPRGPTEEPAVAARDIGNAVILVDRAGRARADESHSEQHSKRRSHERAGRSSGAAGLGVDVQAILAKSLELARVAAGAAGGVGKAGGTAGGVDVQAILAKSFELAGLVTKPREAPSEPTAAGRSQAEGPTIDGEATDAPDTSGARETSEVAEKAREKEVAPRPVAEADVGTLAGSGWEADGWELVADEAAPGPLLFGYASSGIGCDVGNKIRSVWRPMILGRNPKLSYVRKLDLSAAVNILTTASFTVMVDGVPVDEVSAVGMDYAEPDWTERSDIDLAPFAGRTVTLSFEVAANSNVCMEVYAKAWLRGVTVRDAARTEA
jgi:hypothetical protein